VPRDGKDYALIGIASGVAATGLLWLAGAAAAVLSGHRVPHHRPLGGLAALAHFGNPSLGWKAPVGPPVLYWTVTALVSLAAGSLVWLGRRLVKPAAGRRHSDDPTRAEGLASSGQVRQHAGPKALTARASTLRPSLARAAASDVGYRLGHAVGVECWASVEDSILLLGPPRSGKGHNFVIPMILDSPGPVVSTSTRPDNLAVTVGARSKAHPVAVFDPQGLATARSLLPSLRWSLVRGCERPQTAMLRAAALVADAGRSGVENANFWRQQTVSVVRCLLHAAAVHDRPAADLYRWSHGAAKAKEAVAILARDPKATPGWDSALDAIIAADPRTRDSIWAMVANTFASLADPAVLAAVTPARDDAFNPAPFLAEGGSLYLLGTASGASASANLVAAFVEDVTDTARRVAATSPGARLDPPLGLILDEAANYPLPSLPALMAEGGGSGITTVAVLQSLAQARDRWGRDAAQAIWDAAIVKVVLGGSANADDLSNISRLIGDRDTREWSETYAGNGRSVSSTVRQRRILDPAALRRIGLGHGLLLLRAAPPIMLTLSPWTDRTDAADLVGARRRFEDAVQNPGGRSA
jgi:type IV secretory pathway TraG/TraD family ATPase VirD4